MASQQISQQFIRTTRPPPVATNGAHAANAGNTGVATPPPTPALTPLTPPWSVPRGVEPPCRMVRLPGALGHSDRGLHLWLGGVAAALDPRWLRAHGITDVVSVGSDGEVSVAPHQRVPGINYFRVEMADDPGQPIAENGELLAGCRVLDHITDRVIGQFGTGPGAVVLLHCTAGINRSPAIAAAWYMRHSEVPSVAAAIAWVRTYRPLALRNEGFCEQLGWLERDLSGQAHGDTGPSAGPSAPELMRAAVPTLVLPQQPLAALRQQGGSLLQRRTQQRAAAATAAATAATATATAGPIDSAAL